MSRLFPRGAATCKTRLLDLLDHHIPPSWSRDLTGGSAGAGAGGGGGGDDETRIPSGAPPDGPTLLASPLARVYGARADEPFAQRTHRPRADGGNADGERDDAELAAGARAAIRMAPYQSSRRSSRSVSWVRGHLDSCRPNAVHDAKFAAMCGAASTVSSTRLRPGGWAPAVGVVRSLPQQPRQSPAQWSAGAGRRAPRLILRPGATDVGPSRAPVPTSSTSGRSAPGGRRPRSTRSIPRAARAP